jgi:hypothetical protein
MSPPRVFTLEEVNELVPLLNNLVATQLARRLDIETRLKTLSEALGSTPSDLVVVDADTSDVRAMKRELAGRVEEYQTGWRDIEDLGGVLKDARTGRVDFYGRVDGKLVWLCFRYGDEEIRQYHALDEGFSGTKNLRHSAKHRLLN